PNVARVEGWGRFEELPDLTYPEAIEEAKKIVAQMSLRDKVGQMTPNTTVEQYIPACLKYNDFPYIAGENVEFNLPGSKFTDGPAGVVMGNKSTCFPVSMARGATWDPQLEVRVGEVMGREARALGANLFGGVCVNMLRHPAWGRSQETYGEDPRLLGKMGVAFIEGLQKHVMACVKHYALNSMENMRYKVDVEIDERPLRELYLSQFKACIDSGVAAVMSAYNKFRGAYCGESRLLLTEILREEWGFNGFVVSDFIHGLYDGKRGAEAGLDIEMPICGRYGENLVALVEKGEVDEKYIDAAAIRIISTKIFFSKLGRNKESYPEEIVGSKEHTSLAREVSQKSTVLLKNSENFLPLKREKLKRVVVAGTLAATPNIGEMKGSSRVHPPYIITPLMGLTEGLEEGVAITYKERVDLEQDRQLISEADVVVMVVGLTSNDEGEFIPHWSDGPGGDRPYLGLNKEDLELIDTVAKLTTKTVVVMQGGGMILTHPWDQKVSALLMQWYAGMEGGRALCDLLLGKVNPSAKLPLTIVKEPSQLPYFNKDAQEMTYDYYHGYFLTDSKGYEVSYPFGFGLSYTTYGYSNLSLEESSVKEGGLLKVAVDVENLGEVDGEEVVQLYIGYKESKVERHKKDLREWHKIPLKRGEKKRVTFELSVSDLAYWDGGFVVEKGNYEALVGPSSREEELLSISFEVV
ncbi:MAG: glycosyl hydrolase, partial [Spirochaetales bacterium]|nr:glycosyl hydrolase [Spirochaetales bacterium]